jgi:mannosylglycoprotein endo-beta-mannosidase
MITVELMEIYKDEELMWYQKSHEKWLLEGDLNTSYFHRVANGRKRKNTMMSLDDNGVVIEGTDKLIDHATSYYKNLFGPAHGNLFPINHSMWKPHEKMDDNDNEIISRPFTIEEVKDALFSMKKNKAPGPDNIPIEFYQHCWHIIKNDIMNLFLCFSWWFFGCATSQLWNHHPFAENV